MPKPTKPIILASASPQRKKLLKLLGVKFQVRSSKLEEATKIKTNCSSFVKHNALIKAQDIASRVNKGIIIGADTIVYVGNKKVIGKPKSLKEARKNFKTLFSRPQWVYTGVAMIDAQSGKTLLGYEKTRVHMLKLTDEEIRRYHRRVSPFGKAGGFDIEGWGSAFIRRIEGCYTNVIGLPMAKVATMLKEFGVHVL